MTSIRHGTIQHRLYSSGLSDARELSVVMPVYNEVAAVGAVVASWTAVLERLGIDYELLVYDDGSTDGTGAALDVLAAAHARLRVTHHANRGHGPSIMRGYAEATGRWVFQTDSDDEIPAGAFADLWARRHDADVVIGVRTGRQADAARRTLTWGAATAVRWLYGRGVTDVNAPFRLMRGDALARLVPRVPATAFAPNVILSGLFARDRLRCVEVPVPATPRRTGRTSLIGWKVWKAAARAARDTVAVAVRERFGGARA
jgi:glycosyltransferase involved in cell wall biosynthesis